MKVVVIVFVLVILLVTFANLDTGKSEYQVRCVAEGLILYDGIGTDLEQYNDRLVFRDLNGDKVSVMDAQCTVKELD